MQLQRTEFKMLYKIIGFETLVRGGGDLETDSISLTQEQENRCEAWSKAGEALQSLCAVCKVPQGCCPQPMSWEDFSCPSTLGDWG